MRMDIRRVTVVIDADVDHIGEVVKKVRQLERELDFEVKEYSAYYNFDYVEDKCPSDQIQEG